MSHKRRLPKHFKVRRCALSGKQAHRSPNSAMVHLLSLERSKAYDGIKRVVYPCRFHPGEWLVGRPRRRQTHSSVTSPRPSAFRSTTG